MMQNSLSLRIFKSACCPLNSSRESQIIPTKRPLNGLDNCSKGGFPNRTGELQKILDLWVHVLTPNLASKWINENLGLDCSFAMVQMLLQLSTTKKMKV